MVIIHTGTGLSLRSAKSPLPPAQPLHPFLTSTPLALPCSLPFHSSPRNPSLSILFALHLVSPPMFFSRVLFSFSSLLPSLSLFPPLFSPLSVSVPPSPSVLSTSTLEDTLFCKSNKPARVLHLMDAHTHSDRLNAG